MKIYAAFDDTDVLDAEYGTGKLVRLLASELPAGISLTAVIRHQLLVADDIPYTSHNSPACAIVELEAGEGIDTFRDIAIAHIERLASPGSDPGLCIARADEVTQSLIDFGRRCGIERVTQDDARAAAGSLWLSGHGGSNDGIIGAAAAVGLTAFGWDGRFIELCNQYGGLRDLPNPIRVRELETIGILPITLERNVQPPQPDDMIDTGDWLRPRLYGGRAVLPLLAMDQSRWRTLGRASHAA
jgi:hypothetical protein